MPDCFVLLVDDEIDFVSVLAERLEARDLEVDTAGDGETALAKAREQAFDAILLDMAMPGMDGIQTLKGLLAINPDIQVILLTGQATLRQAVEAMSDILQKEGLVKAMLANRRESFKQPLRGFPYLLFHDLRIIQCLVDVCLCPSTPHDSFRTRLSDI